MTQETLEPLDDLYDKFGLKSTATSDEIKKAYRKAALINHPDKQDPNATQQEKDAATEAFQKISHYYSILSDPIKRKRYDQTGRIDGLDLDPSFASWTDYFEAIFEKLTEEAIVAYEKQYRLDHVTCAELDDIERFQKIIEEAIAAGEVSQFRAFPKINQRELETRKKQSLKEEKEVNAMGNAAGDGLEALRVAIQSKGKKKMENLITEMTGKYKAASKTKKKNKEVEEPSEEEFERLQAEMFKNKTGSGELTIVDTDPEDHSIKRVASKHSKGAQAKKSKIEPKRQSKPSNKPNAE